MSAASMKVFASRVEHGGYVSSHGSPISHSPELSARKSDSNLRGSSATLQLTEALARLTPSVSNHERNLYPCFFHRRFQDAVNIDKILRELTSDDDDMSHSKLSQSAIAVREVSKHLQRRPLKRAVRNVMIITKARDNSLVNLTHELTDWLLRTPRYGNTVGVNVYVDKKLQHSKRFNAPGLIAGDTRFSNMLRYWTPDLCSETPHKFDLVLTLGGDGTVLFTSKLFQRVVPPVLSFSMGSLGFLTPFEFGNYQEDLNRVMGGVSKSGPISNSSSSNTLELTRDPGMRVNLRMRFTCTLHRVARKSIGRSSNHTTVEELQHYEVLNELVIDRGPSPYVSNLELYGDDDLLTVIQADGVIFSTPTGSTAYSLSAGGALVHPDIPAILLTPICPHTLSFRPMLLNDTMTLRVSVPRHSRATAYCSFDGKNRLELRQGDYVTIVASRYPFPMVVGETKNEWIDSVSKTLRWNTREAVQRGWEEGKRRNRASRVGVAPVGVRDYLKGSMWNMHPQEGDEDDEGDEEGEEEACTEDDDHDEDDDERFDIDFDDESALASAASRDSGFADNMSMSQAGAMSPPPSNRGPL